MKKLSILIVGLLASVNTFATVDVPVCLAMGKVPICHTPSDDVSKAHYICVSESSAYGNPGNGRAEHHVDRPSIDPNGNNNSSSPSHNLDWIATDKDCKIIPEDICIKDPSGCEASTHHNVGHTLNVFMGGFEDNLYVCGIKINQHLCTIDDVNANADFIVVDGVFKGKEVEFDEPSETNPANTEAEIHLNSFRFGTEYEVKYCYRYTRAVTPGANLFTNLNQQGYLYGNFSTTVTNNEYTNIANISANLSYSCPDAISTGQGNQDIDAPLILNSSYDLSFEEYFDLGYDIDDKECTFTAKFTEGNIGKIRPINHNAGERKYFMGQITTNVELWMELSNSN